MKVTKWIDWVEFSDYNGKEFSYNSPYMIVTGYCGIDNITNNDYEEMRQAVIHELRENSYHFSGNEHQNVDHCVPVVDDKYAMQLSVREWGCIMEDAYPDEDYSMYKDGMGYCKWSFICLPEFIKDMKFPKDSTGKAYYNDFEESAQ